jgi:hypothetical protein
MPTKKNLIRFHLQNEKEGIITINAYKIFSLEKKIRYSIGIIKIGLSTR